MIDIKAVTSAAFAAERGVPRAYFSHKAPPPRRALLSPQQTVRLYLQPREVLCDKSVCDTVADTASPRSQ